MKNENGLVEFIRNVRHRGLFKKNLIIYTTLIMVPIFIFVTFFYAESKNMLKKEIQNTNLSSLQRLGDVTDSIINELKHLVISISLHDEVKAYMYHYDDFGSGIDVINKIKDKNKTYMSIYKYIDSIYIYSQKKGEIIDCFNVFTDDTLKDNLWLKDYEKLTSEDVIFVLRKKSDIYPNVISIIKPNIDRKHGKIGAVVLNVNIEVLGGILELQKNPMSQYNVITDEKGVAYYSKNKLDINLIEKYNFDKWDRDGLIYVGEFNDKNETSMVAALKSKTDSFYYFSVVPMEYYNQKTSYMMFKCIIVALFCLIVGILMSVAISLYSFRPISKIVSSIQNSGAANNEIDKSITDELKYIVNYISRTALAKENMKSQLDEQIIQLKKVHNIALQSQINPHFLCNTLEIINWKAYEKLGGDNEVSEMIGNLSDIYEYLMKVNDFWVTVSEEIIHTKKYIEILKIRYKNKFDVYWDVPNELLEYQMLKLSLQPLIENGIYHGIKPSHREGKINIKAEVNDGAIIFKISDDGVGIPQEKLEEIKKTLNSQLAFDDGHIGLTNVNQRTKVVFGSKFGLKINSNPNEGTTITLSFPAEK